MKDAALLQHPLLLALRRALRDVRLTDSPLLLAVSGGPDSTALAGAMALLQRRGACGLLRIAHVHHGQRDASDGEVDLVRRTADVLELPCATLRLDVSRGVSPALLRKARYEALCQEAQACRADAVLTGHHAEDQLETVLLSLVRGAGPGGLAGMPALRALDDDVRLFRPLLQVSRADCIDLCSRLELETCTDPTNTDPGTARGLLRRDVLPALESMRPAVARRVAAMAPVQNAAAAALGALLPGPKDSAWDRHTLARLPHAVRLAALHAAAIDLADADDLSAATLSEAADAVADEGMHQRIFEVGGGVELVLDATRLRISRSTCSRS